MTTISDNIAETSDLYFQQKGCTQTVQGPNCTKKTIVIYCCFNALLTALFFGLICFNCPCIMA